MSAMIKITLVKSTIGKPKKHRDVVAGLGLTKLNKTVELPDTPEIRGMIAKIGLGFAVAGGCLPSIEGASPVASCINGSSDDVGQWVFTDGSNPIRIPGFLHRIQMHHISGFLIAEVHLFADSCAPRYGVVIGKLK